LGFKTTAYGSAWSEKVLPRRWRIILGRIIIWKSR
jgi:hypothetical protein